MNRTADIAVVGAGIAGLAHAYIAAKAGKRVVVFEKSPAAMGASPRNFGLIWPIGQPPGEMHETAMRSRALWLEALEAAAIPYHLTGSIHAAHREDEAEVAREFAAIAPEAGYECEWLSRDRALEVSRGVNPDGLLGALWSPTELTVDPAEVIGRFPDFLRERHGVEFRFSTCVRGIELPRVEAGGESWEAEMAIVCVGDEFGTLYPELFANSGITRVKLQMMSTPRQPNAWQLGPALAGGLTLRFYPSFQMCSRLPALEKRVAEEMPEYDRWGIHVMISQRPSGVLTIGDSHEYGLAVDFLDKPEVDELILDYARKLACLPEFSIARRWHGVYAKHPALPFVRMSPAPGVEVITALGGAGMTLSFGLAERTLAV